MKLFQPCFVVQSLISISTPAGSSRPVRASIVFCDGLITSISLLWVLISNCSLLSLYLWTARRIVTISYSVGSGMGPETSEPFLFAVSTIFFAAASIRV